MSNALTFTKDGAGVARELIDECLEHATRELKRSIAEGNAARKEYWLERWLHLSGELNWIDRTIYEIEAAAGESNTAFIEHTEGTYKYDYSTRSDTKASTI